MGQGRDGEQRLLECHLYYRDGKSLLAQSCLLLEEERHSLSLINQFSLKRRQEGKDLNRRKNDFRDVEVASQLLCSGEFPETMLP